MPGKHRRDPHAWHLPIRRRRGGLVAVIAASCLLLAGLGVGLDWGLTGPEQPAAAVPVLARPHQAILGVEHTAFWSLPGSPTFISLSPDGRTAYVTRENPSQVVVLDTTTGHQIGTVPIPAGPAQFVSASHDGKRIYVSVFEDTPDSPVHEIDVIDTHTLTQTAAIAQIARPFRVAVSPDDKRLLVPNHDIAQVSVIDAATNQITGVIDTPPNPHWVSFSRDGKLAFAANHMSNVVSVISMATQRVLAILPVGISPHSIAANPRYPIMANTDYNGDDVTMCNSDTLRVVATIPVGHNPQDIVWSPDGRFMFVANNGSNNVSVIDARSAKVIDTIPTGSGPTSIAVGPDERAYVTNQNSNNLSVLQFATT